MQAGKARNRDLFTNSFNCVRYARLVDRYPQRVECLSGQNEILNDRVQECSIVVSWIEAGPMVRMCLISEVRYSNIYPDACRNSDFHRKMAALNCAHACASAFHA